MSRRGCLNAAPFFIFKIPLDKCGYVRDTYGAMKTKKQYRENVIRVRVTEDEKVKFEKLASAKHSDISEVIRQLLHREADQVAA